MRHGEYIALGKIEAILKTSAAVSNIVVYGSGTFIINLIISRWVGVNHFSCRLEYADLLA